MASRPPVGRRPPPAAPPPAPPAPEPKKVPANVIVLTIVLMLLSFGCGYGALVVQADLAQPVASGNVPCSPFTVGSGDSVNTIADRLQQAHIIRNALLFKIYLKIKGKTLNVQPGSYCLSPSMHLSDIITTLSTPPSAAYVQFYVPEGDRLLQYPTDILNSAVLHDPGNADDGLKGQRALPNFNAGDFLNITIKTGTLPGIENFWYVRPWKNPALTKLEGYLSPNTYQVAPTATAADIITTMLTGLGEQLCPGPAGAIDAYLFDEQQCLAHGATITIPSGVPGAGKSVDVFTSLKRYGSDPVAALQKALTLGSLAQRESRTKNNFYEVASVYYNRYSQPNSAAGTNGQLGADPAEQYWLGATGSDPWPTLTESPKSLASNPYNLYLVAGLPPSAIAGMSLDALYGGIDPPTTDWFYFFHGCDGSNHYSMTLADQTAAIAKYGSC
jgi:UPF0755 protein